MRLAPVCLIVVLLPFMLVARGFSRANEQAPSSSPTVRIGIQKGNSYEIQTFRLEDYIARVLAGEALPGSAPAAMEALAIAVRTYTQVGLGKHKADGFDLCDQTHCQVMRTATPVSERAAQATAGQILLFKGVPATIYYSASCGGRTELPSEVWPGAENVPYLPSQPDDGCAGGQPWTAELALADLRRVFAAAGFKGTLRDMRIAARNGSGRVSVLRLDGLTPSEISGQDLRTFVGRTLGSQYVRSAAFEMRRSGDVFRMDGRGYGHGVGMCVIGASNFAAAGKDARTILAHYYPGLEIGTFAPRLTTAAPGVTPVAPAVTAANPPPAAATSVPAATPPAASVAPAAIGAPPAAEAAKMPVALAEGVTVSAGLPNDGARIALSTIAARERDRIAKLLGVPAPARLAVRMHATSDEYERASGRKWFTQGALVNGEIQLPPLASLNDPGSMQRMVSRQIVHLLVDQELAKRPAWVREGAALYFGDGQAVQPNAPRVECPTDDELQNPLSAGALVSALTAARSCFERQIASGRSWREVR